MPGNDSRVWTKTEFKQASNSQARTGLGQLGFGRYEGLAKIDALLEEYHATARSDLAERIDVLAQIRVHVRALLDTREGSGRRKSLQDLSAQVDDDLAMLDARFTPATSHVWTRAELDAATGQGRSTLGAALDAYHELPHLNATGRKVALQRLLRDTAADMRSGDKKRRLATEKLVTRIGREAARVGKMSPGGPRLLGEVISKAKERERRRAGADAFDITPAAQKKRLQELWTLVKASRPTRPTAKLPLLELGLMDVRNLSARARVALRPPSS